MKISKQWKKTKKTGHVINLHKCSKNYDHMVYCSWDMAHDRCNCYFSFWAIFCPFTALTCLKNENFKKNEKQKMEISSFYTCVPKIMIICNTVPEIWHVTDIVRGEYRPFLRSLTGLVVESLDSQSMGPVFKSTGWLQGQLSLSSFRGW